MTDIEKEPVAVALPPGAVAPADSPEGPTGSQGHSSGTPMWQQEKQGSRCCGFCCDFRRAVIILGIISLLFNFGYFIFGIVAPDKIPSAGVEYDDDVTEQVVDDLIRVTTILSGVSLVCTICALVGAIKYNIYLVAVNVLWIFGNFVARTMTSIEYANDINQTNPEEELSLIPNVILSAIFAGLYMYPHVGFIHEVRQGIMSYETYPREEYSCCCTPNRS